MKPLTKEMFTPTTDQSFLLINSEILNSNFFTPKLFDRVMLMGIGTDSVMFIINVVAT